jgi:hypothetical protein
MVRVVEFRPGVRGILPTYFRHELSRTRFGLSRSSTPDAELLARIVADCRQRCRWVDHKVIPAPRHAMGIKAEPVLQHLQLTPKAALGAKTANATEHHPIERLG